ncbi:MAG TPA: RNA polymerase sigma factor [Nitriliruptorales bacterium]|nr:RNA polymerase sigma factor [Nitriliruptorales bacterium]
MEQAGRAALDPASDALELVAHKPDLGELLDRGLSRGYVLLSELHEHYDPLNDDPDWVNRAVLATGDLGVEVVDDLAGDADRPAADLMSSSTDPVRHYLNAIGKTALLTAEEEVDLAKRDQAGVAARDMLGHGGALPPRRRALLRQIDRDGRRAQDHMVRANLRLVVSVARRYRGRGLDLLDLIQEGNLGLMRAVEKFDHTKGYKFSTYATWWIRQALTRGLADKSRVLRLPVHVHETLGKMRWAELDLVQQLGREPSEGELAEAMDMTLERLRDIRSAARDLLSLDTPVGEDGDTTMGHLVADDDAVDPESAAAFTLTRHLVRDVLGTLNERERGVVMLRFGLLDGECRTLEEVGARYGVTRERIRQIEAKTLTKLRHPSRSDRLRGLLESAPGRSNSSVAS